MIRFENTEVQGFSAAIRGMRNPMNSWAASDSGTYTSMDDDGFSVTRFLLGDRDAELARKLVKAGSDHRKFLRQIIVWADITAPRYWWAEYDTYKVGTVANSCSTMHKIHAKRFEVEDFSIETVGSLRGIEALSELIVALEHLRLEYNSTKDTGVWREMIQLLPSSYNQRRTVMLSYEVLLNIVGARNAHKLVEWREFCKWAQGLPYLSEILGLGGE